MKTAIIATHNTGKAKEFKAILEPKGFTVKTLADIGFTEEIEETGQTFEENAIIKAEAIQAKAGEMVIAQTIPVCQLIIWAENLACIQRDTQVSIKTMRRMWKKC
ncbi:hypothetical protein BsIDN1_49630 [Bacillus safensis]|uniref:Non-canonical purine NTP pyrophosphatase n=1 Tax=Bacillus safensis TaxID=561879 RepID=A0A5S9MF07_BACIA|nr:hypothetical protein BsIDN1_49630 [Bacillus safensis]